jgi:hypothetical protein
MKDGSHLFLVRYPSINGRMQRIHHFALPLAGHEFQTVKTFSESFLRLPSVRSAVRQLESQDSVTATDKQNIDFNF